MNRFLEFIDDDIVLTRKEAEGFIEQLMNPDPEMIARRDKVLEDVGKLEYNESGTGFTVEVKGLDTEYLKNKIKERKRDQAKKANDVGIALKEYYVDKINIEDFVRFNSTFLNLSESITENLSESLLNSSQIVTDSILKSSRILTESLLSISNTFGKIANAYTNSIKTSIIEESTDNLKLDEKSSEDEVKKNNYNSIEGTISEAA